MRHHNIERVCLDYIRKHNFRRIIATVSGGPDSVALLSALLAGDAAITAAHCNFHLRGEESMRDQTHVEKLCRHFGVPLLIKDFDVAAYSESNKGVSTEMACRNLRHEWFRSLMTDLEADRIATGHNADDNIETLFLNLMRGSGTSGLRGMLPDTGIIWRPLLSFHRPDILSYLKEKSLSYITDSTNLESDFRRNFLRNDILPLLRSRWPGFDKALDRSISILREENKIVNAAVAATLPEDGEPLHTESVAGFPNPELLIRRYIEPLGPFTTTASEVIAAIKADKPDKKTWQLRHGTLLLKNHRLFLCLNG